MPRGSSHTQEKHKSAIQEFVKKQKKSHRCQKKAYKKNVVLSKCLTGQNTCSQLTGQLAKCDLPIDQLAKPSLESVRVEQRPGLDGAASMQRRL